MPVLLPPDVFGVVVVLQHSPGVLVIMPLEDEVDLEVDAGEEEEGEND